MLITPATLVLSLASVTFPSGASAAPTKEGAAPLPAAGLIIMKDGENVTGKTIAVWAGQQISLTVSANDGAALSNPVWSLANGGYDHNPIADWTADANSGTVTDLTTTDKSQLTVTFYYMAGQGLSDSVSATVAGKTYGALVTLNVSRPAHSVASSAGTLFARVLVANPTYNNTAGNAAGLGDYVDGYSPGVLFTASFPKSLYGGTAEWVQIVNSTTVSTGPNGHTGLDHQYPFHGHTGTSLNDSPQTQGITTNYYTRADTFSSFLMWRPDLANAIYVPLSKEDWGFGVDANVTGGWHLDPEGSYITGPTATDPWTVEPQWTQNNDP